MAQFIDEGPPSPSFLVLVVLLQQLSWKKKSVPRLPSAWGNNHFQRNIFEGNQRWTWFRRTCQLKTIFLEHDCEGKRQIQKSLQQSLCQSKCWVRSRCWICLIGGSNWTKIWEMWTMLSESALTGIKERKIWSTDDYDLTIEWQNLNL